MARQTFSHSENLYHQRAQFDLFGVANFKFPKPQLNTETRPNISERTFPAYRPVAETRDYSLEYGIIKITVPLSGQVASKRRVISGLESLCKETGVA